MPCIWDPHVILSRTFTSEKQNNIVVRYYKPFTWTLRQENFHKFKTSQGNRVRPCLESQKRKTDDDIPVLR